MAQLRYEHSWPKRLFSYKSVASSKVYTGVANMPANQLAPLPPAPLLFDCCQPQLEIVVLLAQVVK
jgi:hypothetical protein